MDLLNWSCAWPAQVVSRFIIHDNYVEAVSQSDMPNSTADESTSFFAGWDMLICKLVSYMLLINFIHYAVIYSFNLNEIVTYGGRFEGYWSKKQKVVMQSNICWVIMESPSFFIPIYFVLHLSVPEVFKFGNKVALCCFIIHYFHRSFIYGFFHRGSDAPVVLLFLSFFFTFANGLAQSLYLTRIVRLDDTSISFYLGLFIFLVGMIVNIHADYTLINLRRPNEKGEKVYRIPHGGLFRLVSAANYVGEIIEWFGFAVMCNLSLPSVAFALSTFGTIGIRAIKTHAHYLERFGSEYPSNRKALIPFIY